MGYETRLIIGTAMQFGDLDGGAWYLSKIAEIDLCKSCFYDTYIDEKRDVEKAFIYASDGDTKITKDKYAKDLVLVPPKEVLKMMKVHNRTKYRRYEAAIPMLESLIKTFAAENLQCILFGH